MEYRNYIELDKMSLLYQHYCYVDTNEHLADGIFVRHQIVVRFDSEYVKKGEKYQFIFCKVRKRDKRLFVKTMEELKKKMLLTGNVDYEAFCLKMMQSMLNESEKCVS